MARRWRRWFVAEPSHVIEALSNQAQTTTRGLEAFLSWSSGDSPRADEVRTAEHDADEARWALERAIHDSFVTPVNPEDVFELSERLDKLINGAKNVVREAEVLATKPDAWMAEMAGELVVGTRELTASLALIATGPSEATDAARRAISTQRNLERTYRRAMSGLLAEADVKVITAKRELYRRYARIGDDLESVAERILYTIIKQT